MTGTDLIPAIDLSGTEEEQRLAISETLGLLRIGEQRDSAMIDIEAAARLLQSGTEHGRTAAPGGGFFAIDGSDLDRLRTRDASGLHDFMKHVRLKLDRAIWRHCIEASHLANIMDATAKKELEASLHGEDFPEATPENLAVQLRQMLVDGPMMMRRGVVELFRALSPEHRTNDRFTIGDKLIIKYVVEEWDKRFDSQHWYCNSYGRSNRDHLIDLERTLCLLTGREPPTWETNLRAVLDEHGLNTEPRKAETDLFRFQWFKNGTMHVWIKDPEHVALVNRIIAEHYGEVLPAGHDATPGKARPKDSPMPKQTRVPEEVLDVLRRGKWTVLPRGGLSRGTGETYLFRLPEQLSRELYVKVDQVIRHCGGKWQRNCGAHVFDRYSAEMESVLRTGEYVSSRDKGQFFTPPELAKRVVELAEIKPGMRLLEPEAGAGRYRASCAA